MLAVEVAERLGYFVAPHARKSIVLFLPNAIEQCGVVDARLDVAQFAIELREVFMPAASVRKRLSGTDGDVGNVEGVDNRSPKEKARSLPTGPRGGGVPFPLPSTCRKGFRLGITEAEDPRNHDAAHTRVSADH